MTRWLAPPAASSSWTRTRFPFEALKSSRIRCRQGSAFSARCNSGTWAAFHRRTLRTVGREIPSPRAVSRWLSPGLFSSRIVVRCAGLNMPWLLLLDPPGQTLELALNAVDLMPRGCARMRCRISGEPSRQAAHNCPACRVPQWRWAKAAARASSRCDQTAVPARPVHSRSAAPSPEAASPVPAGFRVRRTAANGPAAEPNATYFLWGGPPGPQAHPLVGFLGPRRMAGQGAGCGSGDPPHRAGSMQSWKSKWHLQQSLGLTYRPDHRFQRVPAQLLERRDGLVAVHDQVTAGLA